MAAMNMTRETRICLAAFAMLSTAVTFNLLFFQGRRMQNVETAAIGPRESADYVGMIVGSDNARQSSSNPQNGGVTGTATAQGAVASITGSTERPLPTALAPPGVAMSRTDLVRAIQTSLAARGYEPGAPDGLAGLMTRAAIIAYESDSGLALTGVASDDLLRRLQGVTPVAPVPARGTSPQIKTLEAATLVRDVGQWLGVLGYPVAKNETSMSPALVRAIRDYEASQKMPETGRISAALVARLSRAAQGRLSLKPR